MEIPKYWKFHKMSNILNVTKLFIKTPTNQIEFSSKKPKNSQWISFKLFPIHLFGKVNLIMENFRKSFNLALLINFKWIFFYFLGNLRKVWKFLKSLVLKLSGNYYFFISFDRFMGKIRGSFHKLRNLLSHQAQNKG